MAAPDCVAMRLMDGVEFALQCGCGKRCPISHGVPGSGHEHGYERLKPEDGIHYFILGNSASL